jgi:hypothetical protein
LLAVCEFPSPAIVDAEAIHYAVYHEKAKFISGERLAEAVEKL